MLTEDALTVLKARYLWPGETPEQLFWRVAAHVAAAEKEFGGDFEQAAHAFYQLMASQSFLPNSPALMNAGKPRAQLAACFVLPIEDSLAAIFETLKEAALIHQSGGGTGFSFSRLRPQGDSVSATGGQASGPVSFLQVFNAATSVVKQGAVRSGANMAILRVDHPDIRQFATAKSEPDVLNNFNLSVGITDEFMAAVHGNEWFSLCNPHTGKPVERIRAKVLFDLLVDMAWHNGEPGLFFLDTVNRANPTPRLGEFESPNPCSEQPLLPYESCVLGSINLNKILTAEPSPKVDWEKLDSIVRMAVRFLDDVIEVNCFPLPQIAAATRQTRKIGLGIMGLADVFITLGIPYASLPAARLTARIMRFITSQARFYSRRLAEQRGAFPAFPTSIYDHPDRPPLRNATVTTIAPTGSISIIAGCSPGIEPLFGLAMTRRVLDGRTLVSVNEAALSYLRQEGLLTKTAADHIAETGTVYGLTLPEHVRNVLATAREIPPLWHLAHLAAAQRYTDNGVSKTVNLPHDADREEVAEIFLRAHASGCKGVTVYRDGSREQQVLTPGTGACPIC